MEVCTESLYRKVEPSPKYTQELQNIFHFTSSEQFVTIFDGIMYYAFMLKKHVASTLERFLFAQIDFSMMFHIFKS